MNRRRFFLRISLLASVWAIVTALQTRAWQPGGGQQAQNAAVLVQFGDGSSVTRCVTFQEQSINGLELLARSGLDVSVWGTAVCRVEGEGCNYPAQRCFCQCLATPCRFWSYWQWRDGRWVYSQIGASQRALRDGDVDAWVWGDGQSPPGVVPSEPICPPAAVAVPTSAPLSTQATPSASATAGPSGSPPGRHLGTLLGQYACFSAMAAALLGALWLRRRCQPQHRRPVLHTLTWVAWLTAAAFFALLNQQPLQSMLLILASGAVYDRVSRRHPQRGGWSAFLRLGIWMWLVALAFNVLSVHAGEIVLFSLPRTWPIVGGPITLEALLYGLSSGASLFAVLLVFAAFNLAVEPQRLLRWIPAGLYQAGLIVSIAVAFVPQLMASLRDIRDAQRIRGHVFRGLRDLVPLFVPLITTGLERSLALAESMEARGFGGMATASPQTGRNWPRITAVAGLLMVLLSVLWPALWVQPPWASLLLLGLGLALTLLSIWGRGQQVKRTHYHHERWRREDTFIALASALSLMLALLARMSGAWLLSYYPYPPLSPWPGFAPAAGLAAALLAAPALVPLTSASDTKRAVEGA